MIDWTLIAGGRCNGQPWRIGIAGFDLEHQQAFVLSDTDLEELHRDLPLEPLRLYGEHHALLFTPARSGKEGAADGLLLITHPRDGQATLESAERPHRYLVLRHAGQRDMLVDESSFTRLFSPEAVSNNHDERLAYLASDIASDPGFPADAWAIPREPDEQDHSRLYHLSADRWVHTLTSSIAGDATASRGTAPLLSVIIPTFNHGPYLGQCVQSVLDQGLDDVEILVLDNASTDETSRVMEAFATEPRVRYMRNRYNYGPGYNWRNGLRIAQGRYLTFLSADDYLNPGHLSSLLTLLEHNPHVAVGYTGIRWVDGNGKPLGQPRHPGYRSADYVGGRNEVADLLVHDNYMTPSAVIYRRHAFRKTWKPGKSYGAGDWEMVVQMAERYPDFAYVDAPGVSYRWHGAQESTQFYASTQPLEGHLAIAEGVFERGFASRLAGREREVAAHIERRLAQYPAEIDSPLGQRARALVDRLEALARTGHAPLFSIILTTYNRADLLKDALASVGKQTLRDFEVILVNDNGSPVESLIDACDFPVTYIRQGRNQGLSAARNAGLNLASGRYVCYLDDDDLYAPEHLQILATAFETHPDHVVYTGVEYVNETLVDGERIEQGRTRLFQHETYEVERLFARNYIPVNTWAHPRAMLAEVGHFDPGLTALEDWDMLLRLAARHPFVHIPRYSAEVRIRQSADGKDHMTGREHDRMPALYRKLYARHPGSGSEALLKARQAVLASLKSRNTPPERPVTLEEWLARRQPSLAQRSLLAPHLVDAPTIGILVLTPDGDEAALDRTLDSLLADESSRDRTRVYVLSNGSEAPQRDGLDIRHHRLEGGTQTDALNTLVSTGSFDWFVLVRAGDCFTASGLTIIAQELIGAPGMRAIYADEIMRNTDGGLSAMLRPGFNLDLLLSMPSSMASHWLYRREVVVAAGGFDPAFAESPEYELLLRLIDTGGLDGLGHVDEPLLIAAAPESRTRQAELDALQRHLRNRGYEQAQVSATLPGCYRIEYGHQGMPGVSIIIPTRNHLAQLRRCLETLLEKTAYRNYEVLIVDNDSSDEDARTWLAGIEAMNSPQMRVLRFTGKYNRSAMLNFGARQARGDYLLLLDPSSAVVKEDWLDAMLNHAQRPEVGIVGAKLLHNDGRIQHAGMILGLRDAAATPFIGLKHDDPGYMFRLQVDQDYSAVSDACLLVRRDVFDSVAGGLDESALPLFHGDIDLCLKVRNAGYLVVWTPHAVLLHDALLEKGRNEEERQEADAERVTLLERWLPLIARDPAYNQSLTLHGVGFQVDTGNQMNWRPLRWRPLPLALAMPADHAGCGHYRMIEPSRAMNELGLAEVRMTERYLTAIELERLTPDVVVLQRQMFKDRLEPVRRIGRFSRAFKVAELDDYLPNIPLKSAHKGAMPKDILKTMRESLKLVDRFVVSTAPLAEALAGLHPDIRVVENHLPPRWWGDLRAQRRRGDKPRVGWGGGAGHRGDLELITDVIKTLADEVDWIFFGMCPDNIRPYVREFHEGVSIEDYPARLAALDLDLALAPLEDNLFNRCKSNLRLLEYGACGFPVVCSDIQPYQGSLPVTRVKPRFRDWVDAIRMHTSDLDAAAKAGDALREVVLRDWMLDQKHAAFWLSQWLPD